MLRAEEGTLVGAIWSKILPAALKSGITTMNTAIETRPKHKTSAFSTLEIGTETMDLSSYFEQISVSIDNKKSAMMGTK